MTVIKTIHIIMNPTSGESQLKVPFVSRLLGITSHGGSGASSVDVLTTVTEWFLERGVEVVGHKTKYGGHATEIAKQLCTEGVDVVVAMGGDGTINEVANGLVGSGVTMGVIPLGTANVFSLAFGIPSQILAACELILKGSRVPIDVGKANDRYFLCMAGIGFDAYVIKQVDRRLKRWLGPLSYILTGVAEAFRYRSNPIRFKVDDETVERRGYMVVVGNIKHYGGALELIPKADPQDGYLDICCFNYRGVWRMVRNLWGMVHKQQLDPNEVSYIRAKKVVVGTKSRHCMHIDAEYMGSTPAYISVVPGGLRVIVGG